MHDQNRHGQNRIELPSLLRTMRRHADLSQRDLALRSGVALSTICRIESGEVTNPSFRTVEQLLTAAGGSLVAQMPSAGELMRKGPTQVVPAQVVPAQVVFAPEIGRDRAGRRYPAHLDAVPVTRSENRWGVWWATLTTRQQQPSGQAPSVTFHRRRWARDAERARRARGAQASILAAWRPDVSPRADSADSGGRNWVWIAELGDGTIVGELRAHEFDQAVDGSAALPSVPVPPGTVVLDGIFVTPRWRRLGIGRRLFEALRDEVVTAVVALAPGAETARFLDAVGCHPTRDLSLPRWFVSRAPIRVPGIPASG